MSDAHDRSGQGAAARVVSLARQNCPPMGMSSGLIAIDGPGGAGKSTLARAVSAALGDAAMIHTDDFSTGEPGVEWCSRLLDQVILPLAEGRSARYQRYDWDRRRLSEWHEIPPQEYLIIEGVYASRQTFRPYLALTVWVSTPRNERLRRGLARDGQGARAQWLRWMAEEDAYCALEEPEKSADAVVRGEL